MSRTHYKKNAISLLKFQFFLATVICFGVGCSYTNDRIDRFTPTETVEIATFDLDFSPGKVVWSHFDRTAYVTDMSTNTIHVFKEGRKVNILGGLGFNDDSFSRLADITLSIHGQLLALDSFQKKIKLFDRDGRWMENFSLKNVNDPSLITANREGYVFIFDRSQNEIVLLDKDLKTVNQRIGRFQYQSPALLSSNSNNLVLYDKVDRKTYFFDSFGNFDQTKLGYWQTDSYSHHYQLELNRVYHPRSNQFFAISAQPWKSFLIAGNSLILVSNKRVLVCEMRYVR